MKKRMNEAFTGAIRCLRPAALLPALAACLLVSGCGHNTVSYGDGIMLETTFNPEAYAFGITFRYGKILTACVRENTELEMRGTGSGPAGRAKGGDPAGVNGSGSVKLKIGRQITGYCVEALRFGAAPGEIFEHTGSGRE